MATLDRSPVFSLLLAAIFCTAAGAQTFYESMMGVQPVQSCAVFKSEHRGYNGRQPDDRLAYGPGQQPKADPAVTAFSLLEVWGPAAEAGRSATTTWEYPRKTKCRIALQPSHWY
jgi:hypothetical protein